MGQRNVLRLLVEALKDTTEGVNKVDTDGGDVLKILPQTDDTGAINIGDGTNDVDLKVFLGSATEFVDFNVGNSEVQMNCAVEINGTLTGAITDQAVYTTSSGGGRLQKVTALTANTTLNTTHLNGYITNRGASGAVVVTLPDAATAGQWFEYWGVADQNITFASETADTLLAGLADAAADSLAFSTMSEKVGARATAFYDGTQWHIHALQGTATIATA